MLTNTSSTAVYVVLMTVVSVLEASKRTANDTANSSTATDTVTISWKSHGELGHDKYHITHKGHNETSQDINELRDLLR